jgi:hypothetical protein
MSKVLACRKEPVKHILKEVGKVAMGAFYQCAIYKNN